MTSQQFTEIPAQSPSAAPSRPQILVLADDLTGACDSAAAFLRHGHTARVWLTPAQLVPNPEAPETVWVRHTASRDLSPTAAAQAVTQAAQTLPTTPLIYKKVDSAGRGNIAAELLAAQKAFAADIILLAPSFPAAGRIVRCGILEITDIATQNTNISLAALFPEQHHHRIGKAAKPAQLASLISAGKDILLCDAATDSDLQAVAEAASKLPARILWAGSAGLANALAALYPADHPQPQPTPTQSGTLLITGTTHNVTKLQLQHLLAAPHITPINLTADPIDAQAHNVLQITCAEDDSAQIRALWQRLSPKPAALILTGGDTAALVLHALDAEAIILHGELSPGIPWGTIQSGLAHNCTVVTKSGGFGTETSLTDAVAFIRERHQ
jgi:D-threonate/D-erythronate kinase